MSIIKSMNGSNGNNGISGVISSNIPSVSRITTAASFGSNGCVDINSMNYKLQTRKMAL